ncbi:MAG: penicillin-binding protein 1A [Acetobacteraceae bacterium]
MTEPLKAGERLLPRARSSHPGGPPRQPSRPATGGGPSPGRRAAGRWLAGFVRVVVIVIVVVGFVGYLGYRHFTAGLPSVDVLRHYHPPVMTRVFASNGRLIADFGPEQRIYVPYSEIPPLVRNAFISAEDRYFWYHPGIDPFAIVRAGIWDLLHVGSGRRPLGASTITQQVVKNILLDQPMTFDLKIQEAILALRLEQVLSKKQILAIYLNEIYLGLNTYGVAAAAHAYFDKPLDQLSLAEAAFLAGLPKAPTAYNPFTNPTGAKARRNWVLGRMRVDGYITAAAERNALAAPLVPRAAGPLPPPLPEAGYYVEAVRQELIQRFGQRKATEGGLIVRTSLDPTLQRAAVHAARAGLMAYDREHSAWRGPVAKFTPGPTLAADWAKQLAGVTAPAGMLNSWRLGVLLSERAGNAEIGWLEPAPDAPPVGPAPPAIARKGTLERGDLAWAHGKLTPGDVVMVEPVHAASAKAGSDAKVAADEMLALRQIPKVEGALVSLNPRTGRVLAMVGGWSYRQSQYNRVIDAKRQPGSGFKPFTYLAALEQGIPPSQKFLDAPIVMAGADGPWRPSDFDPGFMGPITMQVGLEQSVNLATLRVAEAVGLKNVKKTAEAFGVVHHFPLYYPAVLGALDTTVMRMAGAYASFDELGLKVTPTLIDSVEGPEGDVLWRSQALACTNCTPGRPDQPPVLVRQQPRIADQASTFQLVTMMKGVVLRGTGVNAGKGIDRPIAGKTGTTDNFNDAWFNGFTRTLVTIVWMGFDTPHSLGHDVTGGEVSAPIWNAFMKVALNGRPVLDWPIPPGITMRSFDTADGVAMGAFKTNQTPQTVVLTAASGGENPAGPPTASTAGAGSSSGVDAGLGGLY